MQNKVNTLLFFMLPVFLLAQDLSEGLMINDIKKFYQEMSSILTGQVLFNDEIYDDRYHIKSNLLTSGFYFFSISDLDGFYSTGNFIKN